MSSLYGVWNFLLKLTILDNSLYPDIRWEPHVFVSNLSFDFTIINNIIYIGPLKEVKQPFLNI